MIDKNGLYDIYGIWHKPFWQTSWFALVCGSLIAVALLLVGIAIGYKLYTWLRRKHYTAWEIAIIKLEHIKNK